MTYMVVEFVTGIAVAVIGVGTNVCAAYASTELPRQTTAKTANRDANNVVFFILDKVNE